MEAYGHVMARIKDLSKDHARGPSSGCQHIPVCLLALKSSRKDSSEGKKRTTALGEWILEDGDGRGGHIT